MNKKFFIAGLTVLLGVSVFLTGCPTDAETKYVTVPGDVPPVVPDDAVSTSTESSLRGLLGANSGVSVIEYTGSAPAADLVIPSEKTVYVNKSGGLTLTANLAVASGAKVVVVDDLTTATSGKLLVNGTVEVARGATLAYNTAATEVTDYTATDAGVITPGTATVIGSGKVQVLKDGTLSLKTADVVAATTANKFTPAEAWSAAGSGHLVIDGTSTLSVTALLTGVSSSADRAFAVTTSNTDALPDVIPAGAGITATGATTSGTTLTVNGSLTAAAFVGAAVTKITVGNKASFSTGAGTAFAGALVTEITVGNGSRFTTASTAFSTAALTKITVGKDSAFTASGVASNAKYELVTEIAVGASSSVTVNAAALFTALTTLSVGASSTFNASAATAPTYAALTTLSVGDYAAATLALPAAATVTFKTTDGLGTLTLGNNAVVDAGAATAANLGKSGSTFSISKDATLGGVTVAAGATLTVATGTTLTVAAGRTLTASGTLAFTDGTSKVVLPATAVIGATATGTFKATPTAANGAGVTVGVYASSDPATLTGFTSNNASAPATVTLTSASAGSGSGSAYIIGNASFLVNNVSTAHAATSETSTNAASAGAGSIAAAASTVVILAGAGA